MYIYIGENISSHIIDFSSLYYSNIKRMYIWWEMNMNRKFYFSEWYL